MKFFAGRKAIAYTDLLAVGCLLEISYRWFVNLASK